MSSQCIPVVVIYRQISNSAVVFEQYIEASCQVENENVIGAASTGDAPTTTE